MMRYRLRTLMIVLAVAPPIPAWIFTNPDEIRPVLFCLAMYYAVGTTVYRLWLSPESPTNTY